MNENRFFSDEDKRIINLIIKESESEPACILELLKEHFFVQNALLYNPQKKNISLAIPLANCENRHIELAKIWDLFALFTYLEDNNYISIVPFEGSTNTPLKTIWKRAWLDYKEKDGKIFIGDNLTWHDGQIFENDKLIMQLYMLSGKKFYPRFETWFGRVHPLLKLHELVAHDYKTIEDIRYEESIKWSRVAGFMAGVGALIALAGLIIA